MGQGSFGTIEVMEHFTCFQTATMGTTKLPVGCEGVMYCSAGEGSFEETIDEPGGILNVLLDTNDDENCVLYVGPFKPSDGGVVMEARIKIADITNEAMFVGFQETLNATTPVMCAEFATESFAYNASCGGFAGLQFDKDATTADWRATAGDNQIPDFVCDSDDARAYNAPVNDKWDVIRVELDPNRDTRIYLGEDTGALKLVKSGTAVMADSCLVHAVVMMEHRAVSDTTDLLEVDYFYAKGYRDWTV